MTVRECAPILGVWAVADPGANPAMCPLKHPTPIGIATGAFEACNTSKFCRTFGHIILRIFLFHAPYINYRPTPDQWRQSGLGSIWTEVNCTVGHSKLIKTSYFPFRFSY